MQNRELTPTGIEEIRLFLDELVKTGVESLTLALPSLIELVRICGYPFRIKASTICQISNANKAALFKKSGVDGMVFDESITRDFEALRRVRNAFGAGTEIIVNSICYQDCQYRMFHYNQISGDSVRDCSELSCSYYPTRCLSRSYEDLSIFAKCSWIRPEDLHYYCEIGIEHFKVQGRQSVLTGDPVRVVEAYMKEEFDGNLRDLLFMFAPSDVFGIPVDNKAFGDFLRPFFEKPGFCVRDCQAHGYCDGIARKCVDVSKADALAGMMLKTIRERDPFRKLLLKKP
jgi:collagenase-like PrtC family protease